MTSAVMRYLALGDSYTIGEGVEAAERWPAQLADRLRANIILLADPTIVARTGWTTGELLQGISDAEPQGPFGLVTLLIGVNDQYRGRAAAEYGVQFELLLGKAIVFTGGEPGRVIVLSIPDWGVTPFAAGRDCQRISAEIDRFNQINRAATLAAGARYVDITPSTRLAGVDATLLAADQLHPSAKLYAVWVALVLPEAQAALLAASR